MKVIRQFFKRVSKIIQQYIIWMLVLLIQPLVSVVETLMRWAVIVAGFNPSVSVQKLLFATYIPFFGGVYHSAQNKGRKPASIIGGYYSPEELKLSNLYSNTFLSRFKGWLVPSLLFCTKPFVGVIDTMMRIGVWMAPKPETFTSFPSAADEMLSIIAEKKLPDWAVRYLMRPHQLTELMKTTDQVGRIKRVQPTAIEMEKIEEDRKKYWQTPPQQILTDIKPEAELTITDDGKPFTLASIKFEKMLDEMSEPEHAADRINVRRRTQEFIEQMAIDAKIFEAIDNPNPKLPKTKKPKKVSKPKSTVKKKKAAKKTPKKLSRKR
jgi:hypothetical protein